MLAPCKEVRAWQTGRAWKDLASKTFEHALQHILALWAWLEQQPVIDKGGGERGFSGAELT